MTQIPSELTEVLQHDDNNVKWTILQLQQYGMFELYKQMPGLFNSLLEAVKDQMPPSEMPFVRQDSTGSEILTFDFSLRVHMTFSAKIQLTYAACHLLRGHLNEIFGHIRRAIEGAGIAYLSKSQPDLAELYISSDRDAFRNRTGTGKILPKKDPLTSDLNNDVSFASQQVHNNYTSLVTRISQSFWISEDRWHFRADATYHELDADDHRVFLQYALWLLRTAGRIARLLAASFDLTSPLWHQALDEFENKVNAIYIELGPLIRINE